MFKKAAFIFVLSCAVNSGMFAEAPAEDTTSSQQFVESTEPQAPLFAEEETELSCSCPGGHCRGGHSILCKKKCKGCGHGLIAEEETEHFLATDNDVVQDNLLADCPCKKRNRDKTSEQNTVDEETQQLSAGQNDGCEEGSLLAGCPCKGGKGKGKAFIYSFSTDEETKDSLACDCDEEELEVKIC